MSKRATPVGRGAAAADVAALAAADVLIAFGSAAKSVKAGEAADAAAEAGPPRADGYLCRFTGPDDPDISSLKDYFSEGTYFGEATRLPVYFHHGLPITVTLADGTTKTIGPGKHKIGTADIKSDETGVFLDAVIDEAAEYQAAVQQLLDDGKLGWSSGCASHLVVREAVAGDDGKTKAHHIKQWLLAEASLTHTPAEPRNVASPVLTSVKSLLADHGGYSWEYEDGYGRNQWDPVEKMGCAAAHVLMWRLERAVDNILENEDLSPAEQVSTIGGVFDEAKGLLTRLVSALASIADEGADTGAEGGELMTAAKSAFVKFVPAGELPAIKGAAGPANLSLADQGAQALSAVAAYAKRAGVVASMRRAGGRDLSAAHRDIARKAIDQLTPLLGEGEAPAAEPAADAEEAAPAAAAEAKTVSLSPEDLERLSALGVAAAN